MTQLSTFLSEILPAPTEFLTVGKVIGDEVTLTIGPAYTVGFLVAGPLLVLAGVVLVWVMYGRVKYFAMEYGYGSGWGRIKAISHYILLGAVLVTGGVASVLIGWANQGYSVVLGPSGCTEVHRTGIHRFRWEDLKSSSERVNSTDFWLSFESGGHTCRVQFVQGDLGEPVQDLAIQIAEKAMLGLPRN